MFFPPIFVKVVSLFSTIAEVSCSFCKKVSKALLVNLIIATVPALIVGFFFASFLVRLCRQPLIIASMLIVFGILLWLADKYAPHQSTMKKMTYKQAFFIGLAQCLSFIPGVSRSGSTMTAARLCQINRSDAAHFSMLLSVPTIAAAGAWMLFKSVMRGTTALLFNTTFFEGVAFSFLGGLLVIWFLMSFVKKHSFFAFMVYRVCLGLFVILYFLLTRG